MLRRARGLALGVCATWLVIQNGLLLALLAWSHRGAPPAASAALGKVIEVLLVSVASMWILAGGLLVGWLLTIVLVRGFASRRHGHEWEMEHGRAR
jgi:hypothetical protein